MSPKVLKDISFVFFIARRRSIEGFPSCRSFSAVLQRELEIRSLLREVGQDTERGGGGDRKDGGRAEGREKDEINVLTTCFSTGCPTVSVSTVIVYILDLCW